MSLIWQHRVEHLAVDEPYPIQDPLGQFFPKQGSMVNSSNYMPISVVMGEWWVHSRQPLAPYHGMGGGKLPYLYHALDDRRAARDAAFMFCKWAYLYPTITENQMLGYAVLAPSTDYQMDLRLKRNRFGYMRTNNLMIGLVECYEYLFDYIQGNEELAKAVHRYIPSIPTEEDVRQMIETRLLQYAAKQVIRFQRWDDKSTPTYLMKIAAVQQDPDVTRPWMESLWKRTYIYPYGSGIGPVTSWTLSTEIFSWRDISNRRQLAALVGLVPTPHSSGDDEREQGISKSGRAELRDLMIEIAWGWLRFQPDSELTKWYQRRFDDGTKRNRKIGIVAVARKLLEWILGHAPYVIPSASAIESLATFGPTKVVGLGGRYANRTASPVLGGGMRIKRRVGPQTLGGLRITAERSTATATGMTTGA